jgi:hypothetical protein
MGLFYITNTILYFHGRAGLSIVTAQLLQIWQGNGTLSAQAAFHRDWHV